MDNVRHDMNTYGLEEGDAQDRGRWRRMVQNPDLISSWTREKKKTISTVTSMPTDSCIVESFFPSYHTVPPMIALHLIHVKFFLHAVQEFEGDAGVVFIDILIGDHNHHHHH